MTLNDRYVLIRHPTRRRKDGAKQYSQRMTVARLAWWIRSGLNLYLLWLASLGLGILGGAFLLGIPAYAADLLPDAVIFVVLLAPGPIIFVWLVFVLRVRSIRQAVARFTS